MKLHLGCGTVYKQGWINCDIRDDVKKDKYVDLNKSPLPFKDNSVDEIEISGVLEYIPDLDQMFAEFARICKNDAKIHLNEPHYTNPFVNSDYHKLHNFNYWTFEYFSMLLGHEDKVIGLKKIKTKLIFPKGKMFFNYLLEPFFNRFPSFYEYVFAGIIKCWDVQYELIVVK